MDGTIWSQFLPVEDLLVEAVCIDANSDFQLYFLSEAGAGSVLKLEDTRRYMKLKGLRNR